MLINAQETNKVKGICASKDGPRINQLLFVDDPLLFVRNQRSEVEVFTRILDTFEKMSGQSINFEKSMVYFIPNTLMPHRTNFGGLLKMKVVTKLDGYLGLPIPIGKKKSSVFKSILDCTTASRINYWSKRLLPNGGKEIFVKSIHQLIPTYAFLVFLGPKGVLKGLHSMISQMWWGSR